MQFVNTFELSDIISAISLVLVVVGGFFGYHQWKNTIKIKSAGYLNELTEKIRTDEDIKEIIYILDYDHELYTRDFHDSGMLEVKMDKALSYFSYICYLYQIHLITKKEFGFFKYEIERILLNSQIHNYIYNLYHFAKKINTPITFKYLFAYGKRINFLAQIFIMKKVKSMYTI